MQRRRKCNPLALKTRPDAVKNATRRIFYSDPTRL